MIYKMHPWKCNVKNNKDEDVLSITPGPNSYNPLGSQKHKMYCNHGNTDVSQARQPDGDHVVFSSSQTRHQQRIYLSITEGVERRYGFLHFPGVLACNWNSNLDLQFLNPSHYPLLPHISTSNKEELLTFQIYLEQLKTIFFLSSYLFYFFLFLLKEKKKLSFLTYCILEKDRRMLY